MALEAHFKSRQDIRWLVQDLSFLLGLGIRFGVGVGVGVRVRVMGHGLWVMGYGLWVKVVD